MSADLVEYHKVCAALLLHARVAISFGSFRFRSYFMLFALHLNPLSFRSENPSLQLTHPFGVLHHAVQSSRSRTAMVPATTPVPPLLPAKISCILGRSFQGTPARG
jgi:hypothetical protein